MSTATTPVRHVRAGVVLSSGARRWRAAMAGALLAASGLALALLVISSVQPDAGAATALGAAGAALAGSALAASVLLAVRAVLAVPDRLLLVGGRDRRHRESLDRIAEPAHPLTAGRPRPRAPGRVATAA